MLAKLGVVVMDKLDHVTVGVAAKNLIHAQAAIAAELVVDAVIRQRALYGFDVTNLECHVVGAGQPFGPARRVGGLLDQVQLAVAKRVPGPCEVEPRAFNL